jgi:hypothetical protein
MQRYSCLLPQQQARQLANICTQFSADSDEGTVDITRSAAHACGGCQSDKRDNQKIFDQSLATLIVVKVLHQPKHSYHFLLLEFCQ